MIKSPKYNLEEQDIFLVGAQCKKDAELRVRCVQIDGIKIARVARKGEIYHGDLPLAPLANVKTTNSTAKTETAGIH